VTLAPKDTALSWPAAHMHRCLLRDLQVIRMKFETPAEPAAREEAVQADQATVGCVSSMERLCGGFFPRHPW
jgi:hypothetical protein